VSKYGIADVTHIEDNVYQIKSFVEKPEPEDAPSNLAMIGCYVLTPDIFDELDKVKPGKSGEIWLVDAITSLMKKRPVYTCEVKNGTYYDTGSKLGWLKANVDFALRDEKLKKEFRSYLKNVI
jgi:UTP--glucose-1-phosphate uridylyltransferase